MDMTVSGIKAEESLTDSGAEKHAFPRSAKGQVEWGSRNLGIQVKIISAD